jgi:DNA-binding transcriptional ArsR family regulator
MPLRLRFGTDDLVRCRFAVSPLCETHEAVRTLRRRARHGYHQPWLRRNRATVAGLDLSALWLLMPPGGYTPDFLGPPPDTPSTSIEEELTRLRGTDPEAAHREFARSLACTPGAAESERGRAMLDDPAAAVRYLADLTEQVWHALIAPDWPRLHDLLTADIAHRSRNLADDGLEGLFADLHPRLSWADGTLAVAENSAPPEAGDLDGRGVLLMPSVFVWPDVISGFAAPWQPTIIYPARGMGTPWQSVPEPPDALVRLLGPNRAAILIGLDEPSSTTALAGRHGLALSSVSAHLSVLRDAGLLTSHRHRRQVRYERTPLGLTLIRGA